jgi:signal transduction histidine kinase
VSRYGEVEKRALLIPDAIIIRGLHTKAYYQTYWVRSLRVVATVLALWGLYRLRVRQVTHVLAVRFDERLAERTRIARDLHDIFLQTVQGSKMVADDALETPSDPTRVRRALEQLSGWLAQAIDDPELIASLYHRHKRTCRRLAASFRATQRFLDERRETIIGFVTRQSATSTPSAQKSPEDTEITSILS